MIRIIKDGKEVFFSEELYQIAEELVIRDAEVKSIEVTLKTEAILERDGHL